MARIVIQEKCSNGRLHPLEWEEPMSCCDHWPYGDRSHGAYEICPSASFCDGAPRRVLDPGSYVLIEKKNGEWPWHGTITQGWEASKTQALYEWLDALAGGEQP